MPSRYPLFERQSLQLLPLTERQHDLQLASSLLPLQAVSKPDGPLLQVARLLAQAREQQRARILFMGGHVIRAGVQRYILDLMERGYISCLAMNGAGIIHDFEFAAIGATTESVARYIRDGRFGLWQETSQLNDMISQAAEQGLGLGEGVGKAMLAAGLANIDFSLVAQAYRLQIPVTVHVGIGYDIIHQMPNCNGAALGQTSYTDFLIMAEEIRRLAGGVVMNFGSAVMGPEVYLKALAMARNVARQQGEEIRDFTALVCDLHPLPQDYGEEPGKDDPNYYFRPWKTILVRTVADGGRSFYVQGRHEQTIPALWSALKETKP